MGVYYGVNSIHMGQETSLYPGYVSGETCSQKFGLISIISFYLALKLLCFAST
jgi:hypothetical protein